MSERVFAAALIVFLRISCSSLPASAAPAARPMSLDDLLTAVRVADPQISPDGRQVAFVRTTTDLASGKRDADVWIVAVDGSAPPTHAQREDRRGAPLLAGPKNARFHLHSRRRAAGVSARSGGRRAAQADGPFGGRAGYRRVGCGRQGVGAV